MTDQEFAERLRAEGYGLRMIWEAKELSGADGKPVRKVNVRCRSVYAPSGALLTSYVSRELRDDNALLVFWCGESIQVSADLEYLAGLVKKVEAREV